MDDVENTPFLVIGNWKMNGSRHQLQDFAKATDAVNAKGCKRVLCLPSILVTYGIKALSGKAIEIGGQDCHQETSGAYTGDTAAPMLAETGATWVIVGHSERREVHGETDVDVCAKAEAALAAGLTPIICLGEKIEDREAGRHLDVILSQLDASVPKARQTVVIAYEPVWAIGTGLSANEAQVAEAHSTIATWLKENRQSAPVLYGGSVKPATAAGLAVLDHLDGFLIGGASLDPEAFESIASLSSGALA